MKILVAHNAYQQAGGEDAVVAAEIELLRQHGHEVAEYRRHNDELKHMGRFASVADTLWSGKTARDLKRLVSEFGPDVLHAHNTFPLISPSLHWAAQALGVPVVQTLHNFRLLCPQAMFLRDGRPCENCLGRLPLPALLHRCYRGSVVQSGAVVAMLGLHRALGTWTDKVDRFVALTAFSRDKLVAGGMPADRIVVKPNFVDLAPTGAGPRAGLIYVGRLSPEKGTQVLAQAAAVLQHGLLKVAGAGPDRPLLAAIRQLQLLGPLPASAVVAAMSEALALVLPSICYENFPRTLVEAYACGLPVIASRLGALQELVEDGVTGLLFNAGDATDLAAKMLWALGHPQEMAAMGRAARRTYELRYTASINLQQLMGIYADARAAHAARSGQAAA